MPHSIQNSSCYTHISFYKPNPLPCVTFAATHFCTLTNSSGAQGLPPYDGFSHNIKDLLTNRNPCQYSSMSNIQPQTWIRTWRSHATLATTQVSSISVSHSSIHIQLPHPITLQHNFSATALNSEEVNFGCNNSQHQNFITLNIFPTNSCILIKFMPWPLSSLQWTSSSTYSWNWCPSQHWMQATLIWTKL